MRRVTGAVGARGEKVRSRADNGVGDVPEERFVAAAAVVVEAEVQRHVGGYVDLVHPVLFGNNVLSVARGTVW